MDTFIKKVNSVIMNLNDSNNFAVERDISDIPTSHKFRIIDVFRDLTKDDRLALYIVLDGHGIDFDDDFGDNFFIILYHPFNSDNMFLELRELVVNMKSKGAVFVELVEIRGNEEPFVPVVKFHCEFATVEKEPEIGQSSVQTSGDDADDEDTVIIVSDD